MEDDPSLLGCPIFRGELLVSGRVQLKQEGSSLPIDFLSVSFIYIEVLELLKINLGGGFKYFFIFTREMIQFDEHILQMGGKKPPTSNQCKFPMVKF